MPAIFHTDSSHSSLWGTITGYHTHRGAPITETDLLMIRLGRCERFPRAFSVHRARVSGTKRTGAKDCVTTLSPSFFTSVSACTDSGGPTGMTITPPSLS